MYDKEALQGALEEMAFNYDLGEVVINEHTDITSSIEIEFPTEGIFVDVTIGGKSVEEIVNDVFNTMVRCGQL